MLLKKAYRYSRIIDYKKSCENNQKVLKLSNILGCGRFSEIL